MLGIIIQLVVCIALLCLGLYIIGMTIYLCDIKPRMVRKATPKPKTQAKPKSYIVVEDAHIAEENRQCTEYGDCYGYSYYD